MPASRIAPRWPLAAGARDSGRTAEGQRGDGYPKCRRPSLFSTCSASRFIVWIGGSGAEGVGIQGERDVRSLGARFSFLKGTRYALGFLSLRPFILVQSAPTCVVGPKIMLPQLLDSRPQCFSPRSLLPHSSQKSNMKILVALAVFFLVSTQLLAEEIGANDDLNYWSDWSDSDQIKVRPGPRRSFRPRELSLPLREHSS